MNLQSFWSFFLTTCIALHVYACHVERWQQSTYHEISASLTSENYKNIDFDQKRNMHGIWIRWLSISFSINILNFFKLMWKIAIFGRKQPMCCELANSSLKAKSKIKEIGGFTWWIFAEQIIMKCHGPISNFIQYSLFPFNYECFN